MLYLAEFYRLGLNLLFFQDNQPLDLPEVTHFPFIVSCTYLVISHLKFNDGLSSLESTGSVRTKQLPIHYRSTFVINISDIHFEELGNSCFKVTEEKNSGICFWLSEFWTPFYNSAGRGIFQFAGLWPNTYSNILYMQYTLDTEVLSTYPYPIHTSYFLPVSTFTDACTAAHVLSTGSFSFLKFKKRKKSHAGNPKLCLRWSCHLLHVFWLLSLWPGLLKAEVHCLLFRKNVLCLNTDIRLTVVCWDYCRLQTLS